MDWIDFRQLPPSAGGFSELFYDYVYDFEEVKQFFAGNFRDTTAFEAVVNALDSRGHDRGTLVTALEEQNRSFGCGEQTFANITLLSKPTTYAVVTGQQVGILGGPMYTVLKTVTAIKLAERLKTKFPHLDFVPVFWIEGEDHDFAEMNHVHLLDGETKPVRIEYLPGGVIPERNPGPVGELVFDAALEATYASIASSLQNTEFTPQLLELLQQSYRVGRTFNDAFASWMNALFSEYGLVFISSNHPALKKLLSPLFVREINEFPRTSQLVIAQSAELEQRYHAQLKAKSVNLFMFHKGGRYAIEPRENDFSLRGTRHFLQKDALLKIAGETPELLSANVVLRPLAQDTLLPTVAYVAGPSEVAYSAQLKPVYEHCGVVQPIVYPRASASFLEERVVRVLEKYQLELEGMFQDGEQVKAKVLEQIEEIKLDRIFGDTTRLVHDALHELRFGVKEVDPTLTSTLDNVQTKFDGTLGVLKEKAVAAQKRRNEAAMRQIDRSIGSLLPNGSLQERELSILYFMNKYGAELPRWLMGEVDITGFKHQILSL